MSEIGVSPCFSCLLFSFLIYPKEKEESILAAVGRSAENHLCCFLCHDVKFLIQQQQFIIICQVEIQTQALNKQKQPHSCCKDNSSSAQEK